MKFQDANEMYLKTILQLQVRSGEAHVKDIAQILNVSKPSVTKALDGLKKKGLISQENYGPVFLTEAGRQTSILVNYKHKIISKYLEEHLLLPTTEAEENACRMEHVITDEMLKAIESKMGIKGWPNL